MENQSENTVQDVAQHDSPNFWDEPEIGAVFGSLRPPNASKISETSESIRSIGEPNTAWGPLTGVLIKVGEVLSQMEQTETYLTHSVYLQCSDADAGYQCRLVIPLGAADLRTPSGEAPSFPDLSGNELRALLQQAQATLPELQALITADFLTQWGTKPGTQYGKSLDESAFSDETLGLWKDDMTPFAAKHLSCRAAIERV
ncbi:MAG: hypothetical protein V4671_08210, partial [Armatimonadota bacterium]